MTSSRRPPWHERLLVWPTLHPGATLGLTALAVAVSLVAVLRMRTNPSLESWYSQEDAGARALSRVIREFQALDTLQILASVPAGGGAGAPEADAARLRAFGKRLEVELRRDARAGEMCADIAWRTPPRALEFVEKVMAPAAAYYLDDEGWRALRRRLTPEGLAEQIHRNEAMISAPGAAEALSKALLRDPLRLHELLIERLASLRPHFDTFRSGPLEESRGGPAFIAPDGRSLLVRITGRRPAGDMAFTKAFMQAARAAVDRAQSAEGAASAGVDPLDVAYAGGYAIAEASERAIRRDAIANVLSSIVLLLLSFLVAYRNPLGFLLAFPPVGIGILAGFAVYSTISTLTPPTAVLGGILAGLGIDYTIHFLSHVRGPEVDGSRPGSAAAVSRMIAPALFSACGTSVVSFLAIAGSDVKALRDFSVLGSIGLIGTFVASLTVLPALLTIRESWTAGRAPSLRVRFSLEPLMRSLMGRARFVRAATLGIAIGLGVVVLAAPGGMMRYETDLTVMHPRPNAPLDTQAEIARRFAMAPDSAIVLLQASSPESLLGVAHRVEAALRGGGGGPGAGSDAEARSFVVSTYGLASLLPDPRAAAARRASLASVDVDQVLRDFRAALDESVFDKDAYRSYGEFLRRLLRPGEPPSTAALAEYPELGRSLLPRAAVSSGAATEAMTVVFLRDPPSDRERREAAIRALRAALAGVPGAALTGMSVLAHDTESTIRRDLSRLLGVAVAAVVMWLAVAFRNVRDVGLAMLPTAFGLLTLLAVMHAADLRFNMVNMLTLPLLIGIGVDNGVFLVSIARARGTGGVSLDRWLPSLAATCHAVMMANATTILAFGSLIWTSTPAIRSFGLLFAVAMSACLAATLLLLPPLLLEENPHSANP